MLESEMRQYRQTLILGLIITIKKLFPTEQLKIAHSILDGVYCELENSLLSAREVKKIEENLRAWVLEDWPIDCQEKENGFFHCYIQESKIKTLYPTLKSSGMAKIFRLFDYPPGFILQFPNIENPDNLAVCIPPAKLSSTFSESQRWVENLHLAEVRDVNSIINSKHSQELIYLAEALHEKKISLISDLIFTQRHHIRVILISGPSSSGKTTFAQRLATQLKVNGLRPVALSLDNYFLNREDTPLDPSGQYDFEALEALDLPLLDAQLKALIQGSEIEPPLYDFVTGKRVHSGKMMKLGPDEILVIEGIHGLNPRLVTSLERHQLFKIYVSSLFQLNINSYNRIPTTEVRLIRRLVRDDHFRGIASERTIAQWVSVRRGENTNIFPYQEEADVMFNSSLLYELNALRPYAEPLLVMLAQHSPYKETAQRLLRLLTFFKPMDSSKVPFNSILREFMGGSIYA